MNKLIRSILAVLFIAIITISSINIFQNITRPIRLDITDQKIYTLSDGTKSILSGLNQPLKITLYYAEKAAMKATDQIKFYNNYYHFVRALLEEYVIASKGMVELRIVDPRPYSDEEVEAIRHGIRRFPITQDENFFFGLVVQTPFGVEKSIEFFTPDRQSFIEYDISYLIENAVTREKKHIGILSSLPVVGDDVTGYMRQLMMMQGQNPKQAWGVVEHLRQKYEVTDIPSDTKEIADIDTLMVIHPKNLTDETLFAIDQFVLKGGRTLIFTDPFCMSDVPEKQEFGTPHDNSSSINKLINAWGLDMPANTFAGDPEIALEAALRLNSRAEMIIGFLGLNQQCFNDETAITANLNRVEVLFSGVLNKTETPLAGVEYTPLIRTTATGNAISVANQNEVLSDLQGMYKRFVPGTKPVEMAYLIKGKLKSAFPEGIELVAEGAEKTNLTEAAEDCAVAIFADVDMISDMVAYQRILGMLSVREDNSALLLNTLESVSGSSNLMSIRSRGNFKRPFVVVDEIEKKAEAEAVEEEEKLIAQITSLRQQLQAKIAAAKGKGELIESAILTERRAIELEIRQAEKQLRQVKLNKTRQIDQLGIKARTYCTLPGPALILVIAIALAIRRNALRRYYIRHTRES